VPILLQADSHSFHTPVQERSQVDQGKVGPSMIVALMEVAFGKLAAELGSLCVGGQWRGRGFGGNRPMLQMRTWPEGVSLVMRRTS
jgi:hypothetical protein